LSYLKLFATLGLGLALISQTPAFACLGPQSEDYVLLDDLPSQANLQPVVAKVEVLSRAEQSAVVRVLEPIKGVTLGQEFEVVTSGSSCSWLDRRTRFFKNDQSKVKSNIYFIAGEIVLTTHSKKQFQGSWRADKRVFPR
jgi:hypothetical protein